MAGIHPKLRVILELPPLPPPSPNRLVIPIPPDKPVRDLLAEVVRRCKLDEAQHRALKLYNTSDALLFPEDEVGDVILSGEIVVARFDVPPQEPIAPPARPMERSGNKEKGPNEKRIKIALITPELARNGGDSKASTVMAFGGSAISVNLSMDVIRREAARTLGWIEDHTTPTDVDATTQMSSRGSCACTTANEIASEGRFEQLHCPREIDGSKCAKEDCPYSHAAIGSGRLGGNPADLECKICMELFGFPCEKCLKETSTFGECGAQDITHCPIVQNAGCHHIFHAHCYYGQTSSAQGCPAGCPASLISREAVPFDLQAPHVVVVHTGSVVEKIVVPEESLPLDHTQVKLIDTEVVELLASKFAHLGPGLTVRMHGRERSGLVSFTHSTVVSICCTSRHTEFDGIVRFALNGLLPPPYEYRSALDLHTASSPIFNEEPNRTLAELGLDESVADGGEITFYVVKRNNTTKVAGSDKRIGKSAVYTVQDDWHPTVRQTDRGMATFLSSLLVFTNYLSGDEEAVRNMHDRVLLYILALSRFPPAVRALHILSKNETILPEEIRALSETMYHLALDAASPTITKGNTTRVFECARILFGVIIERAKRSWTFPSLGTQIIPPPLFSEVSLTCEISGEPLRDPVVYGGQVIERNAARIRQEGGTLFNPVLKAVTAEQVPDSLPLLIQRTAMRVNRLFVVNEDLNIPALQSYLLSTSPFSAAIDMANIEMQIHAPLSLTQVVTPALTLDEEGFNAVYISRGGPCAQPGEDIFLLRPCHGGEVGVDVNVVALRLNPIIEKRKAMGDWDIDAFGSSRTDRVDTREIEEAVVVALDLSRSMDDAFSASDDEDMEDPDEVALENLLSRFSKRRDQLNLALPNAKAFLVSLDCLRSVGRYIFVGEVMQRDRVPPAGDAARRRQRAVDTLDELQVIYTRLHWRRNQGESVESLTDQNLSMWEDFVAVAVNTVLSTELVNHLLLHLTNLYNDSANILLPNGVPERFIDPFSGEIFSDPVKANDGFIYERTHIETWRALHSTSPMDPTINLDKQSPLVPARDLKCSIMTFLHGRVQMMFHSNWRPLMIRIPRDNWEYIALPHTTSALSILFDLWYFSSVAPSSSRLWQGLQDRGDGRFCGHVLEPDTSLHLYRSRSLRATESPIDTLDLARRACYFMASGAQKSRLESRTMSRLDIVKQAFEAFVNKSEVFDHPIAIGLVTFGREVREVQKLTLLKEQFRNTLRSLEADGDTPLYDSLSVAHSMLTAFKAEHPSSALRIICLTDGFDVGSKTAAHTIAANLQRSGVVIDSIVVQTGDAPNRVHPMSVVTGGYSFCVDTLENALNIVELETVLRIKDRVERERKPVVQNAWDLLRYNNPLYYPMDVVTTETCPERKPHARLHENVLSAQKAAARGVPPFSTDRQRRLMQEIRDVVKSPHPAIDVYAGDDLAFWKIVIEAPEGSPYEGGTFLAYIDFGPDYPRVPPEIRFVTKILHPNINRHGKVCHAALDRSWLVDMTMSLIFQILYGILLTPDTDNPLDLHATMEYNDDTGHHALKVQNLVRKFALKTRQQWRTEMEGE